MARFAPHRHLDVRAWGLAALAVFIPWVATASATSPDKRCITHITRWADKREIIPGITVGVQDGRVVYGKNPYTNFVVEVDDELDTLRYHHRLGRVPATFPAANGNVATRAVMPYLHGNGSLRSQGASALASMNLLMSPKQSGLAGDLKRLTDGEGEGARSIWVPVASESVDMPGHGTGPDLAEFDHMDKLIDWMAVWFRQLRKHNLPIIPIARSASPAYLAAFAHKYPELIDGMVLVSPMHPVIGLQENIDKVEEKIREIPPFPGGTREEYIRWVEERLKAGDFVPNRAGLDWCFRMYWQMHDALSGPLAWYRHEDPFNGVPTLILVGENDWQVPESVQRAFRDMASAAAERGRRAGTASRHTVYRQYPGMGHDLLAVMPQESALTVYRDLYLFVSNVLADLPVREAPAEAPARERAADTVPMAPGGE